MNPDNQSQDIDNNQNNTNAGQDNPASSAPAMPVPESSAVNQSVVPQPTPPDVPSSQPAPTPTASTQTFSQQPAQQAPPQPVVTNPVQQPQSWSQIATEKKSKNKIVALLITIIAGLLLLGGVAAAYFTVYLPNKPENAFKIGVIQSLQATKTETKGDFRVENESGDTLYDEFSLNFVTKSDSENHTFSIEIFADYGSATIPVEGRSVGGNGYLKIGDLSPLVELADEFGYGELVEIVNEVIGNKWIEFDKAYLDQLGVGCFFDGLPAKMSDEDSKLVKKAYLDNEFLVIKDFVSEKLGDRDSTRYNVTVDVPKAKNFFRLLQDTSSSKKMKECTDKLGFEESTIDESFNDFSAELSMWLDKKTKTFSKIEVKTKEDGITTIATMTFSFDQIEITKPEGTVPVQSILADLSAIYESYLNEYNN